MRKPIWIESSNNNMPNYDPSQFAISNGSLTKYTGNDTIVYVPNGVKHIDSSAFIGCTSVSEIVIPDSVEAIERYSFVSCVALRKVQFGFGIKSIPVGTFAELPNLETIVLTEQLTVVENFAFRNCKKLASFFIQKKRYRAPITAEEKGKAFELMIAGKPSQIEYIVVEEEAPTFLRIGNYAFSGCASLDSSTIKRQAADLGLYSFDEDCNPVEDNKAFAEESCVIENDAEFFFSEKDVNENETDDSNSNSTNENCSGDEIETQNTSAYDSTPALETSPVFLVDGFYVENGEIRSLASEEIIPDASVALLSLSTRAYNAIYRNKVLAKNCDTEEVMVSDLLSMNPEQLLAIKNMGAKSAQEIIDKVSAYLLSNQKDSNPIVAEQSAHTIAPGYAVIDGKITHLQNGTIVRDVLVSQIGLSVRATNSLNRKQIVKLSELIDLTAQQLTGFPNMGYKSINEILKVVPCYLDKNQMANEPEAIEEAVDNRITGRVVLPPVNMEYQVLAPDYAVVDGVIYSRKTLEPIPDIPIEKLQLSVRSYNCLRRNKNLTVSSLIDMPIIEFKKIRNLGLLSANEIQEKLEQYLETTHTGGETIYARPHTENNTGIIPTHSSALNAELLLNIFHKHEFEPLTIDEISKNMPDETEEDLLLILDNLIAAGKVERINDGYCVVHTSFYKVVSELSTNNPFGIDERSIRILQQRCSGKTLGEVGQQEGATRERIRQIEKKTIERLTNRGHIVFEEDKYSRLFTVYAFEKEFYYDYLHETPETWYYLNYRYTRGKCEEEEALEDNLLSVATRRAVDKYIHRGYFLLDGKYIPMMRGDIEDIVIEKYCKDEVTVEEFFQLYQNFLTENNISDERLQITESIKATRSNRLADSTKLLWKQNKCLRYYDIEGGDFTELLDTLNLGQYENIELSTRKFLMDYPELMEQYDLRDEYELHNLLKKIHAEKDNAQLVFGRMPSLQFGVFNRDAAVKEILFALAPVSQDDLAKKISMEYGVREETVKANWLICISEYYHQGIYSVEYEDMPAEHMVLLKAELQDDFYFLSELRKIYAKLVDNADLSLLSTYNLKKMGFLVGTSYAIQNHQTAESFFEHMLTSQDVIDIAPISKRYTGLTTYSAYLAGIKHDMRIIEFEPYQYINIRRLEKLGFGKEKLKEYGSQAWSFLVDDWYFTIQSLRKDGFVSELDCLGFGDLFYASLLKEDGRFSWQRIGNAIVLNPKGMPFTAHDFLVDYISAVKSIDITDFSAELIEKYGIELDRYTIIEKVKGSDVYYDPIMEKLYVDYSTYFEEI